MRNTLSLLLLLAIPLAFSPAAQAKPVRNVPFTKVIYLATPSGNATGVGGYENAKAMGVDADVMTIQPGMVIEQMYFIVDQAVNGVSSIAVGDDDSATGFLPTAATNTYLATPQILGWPGSAKGSYLKDGSNAAAAAKYYSAAGKEVKIDATGTLNSGKVRLVIQGFNHSYP